MTAIGRHKPVKVIWSHDSDEQTYTSESHMIAWQRWTDIHQWKSYACMTAIGRHKPVKVIWVHDSDGDYMSRSWNTRLSSRRCQFKLAWSQNYYVTNLSLLNLVGHSHYGNRKNILAICPVINSWALFHNIIVVVAWSVLVGLFSGPANILHLI